MWEKRGSTVTARETWVILSSNIKIVVSPTISSSPFLLFLLSLSVSLIPSSFPHPSSFPCPPPTNPLPLFIYLWSRCPVRGAEALQEQRNDGGGWRFSSLLSPMLLLLLLLLQLLLPLLLLLLSPLLMLMLMLLRQQIRGSSRSARAVNKNSNSGDVVGSSSARGVRGLPPIGHRRIFVPLFRSSRAQLHPLLSRPPLLPSLLPMHRSLYSSPSSTCYHSRNGPTVVSRTRGGG